jgi:hypothetical protein
VHNLVEKLCITFLENSCVDISVNIPSYHYLIADGFIRCAEKQRVVFYGKRSAKSLRGKDSVIRERLHGQAADHTGSTRECRRAGEAGVSPHQEQIGLFFGYGRTNSETGTIKQLIRSRFFLYVLE